MPNIINNFAVVIPARYESSRFPGKPLIDLAGRSMINRVWSKCVDAVGDEYTFIATDSSKILEHCLKFTHNVILTNKNCKTGTDRVAEVCKKLNLQYVINVQGDEPLIDPNDIVAIKTAYEKNENLIINAMCPISSEAEFRSQTIPKVVFSPSGKLLYMSRSGIPGCKSNDFVWGYKQVCIYAFPAHALDMFSQQTKKTPLEEQEDIEILRFLELGYEVSMVEVSGNSVAVDTPEDRDKVVKIIHETNAI